MMHMNVDEYQVIGWMKYERGWKRLGYDTHPLADYFISLRNYFFNLKFFRVKKYH